MERCINNNIKYMDINNNHILDTTESQIREMIGRRFLNIDESSNADYVSAWNLEPFKNLSDNFNKKKNIVCPFFDDDMYVPEKLMITCTQKEEIFKYWKDN